MNILLLSQFLAVAGCAVGVVGIYARYIELRHRALPADRSALKGSPSNGILYAFTTGMAPWAKESTRIHMIAYLRGIGFHVGIFAAIVALIASPFWNMLNRPLLVVLAGVLLVGALLGAAGGVLRIVELNLRRLSLPDDHFAVWLTTLFMLVTAFGLISEAARVPMYVIAAATFVYIPLGKIRHCLYFFFSRTFFGKFFGRRAVYPHPEPIR
ncbi:MAG: hypothetical protein ACM3MF_12205 [Anaerolineae bacterium]